MILLYILFRAEHFLFARLGGTAGMVAALSVALKQQVEEGEERWGKEGRNQGPSFRGGGSEGGSELGARKKGWQGGR